MQGVGHGGVGQGIGRGARHGAGHVGDTVVDHTLFDVDGVGVGGGAGCLDAAALVNGHVNDHAARPHAPHHLPRDHVRRPRASDEHRPDHDIGAFDSLGDVVRVRAQGDEIAVKYLAQVAKPIYPEINGDDAGSHAEGHLHRVLPHSADSDDSYGAGKNARHPAQQFAPSAAGLFQTMGSHLYCHPASHFAHRL